MHNHCPIICTGNKTGIQQGKEQVGKFNLVSQDKGFPNVVCVWMDVIAQVCVTVVCGILLFSSSSASQNPCN